MVSGGTRTLVPISNLGNSQPIGDRELTFNVYYVSPERLQSPWMTSLKMMF